MKIEFSIPGEPQPLRRHKHRRFGGGYDPKENVVNKGAIQFLAQATYSGPLLTGPLSLRVVAYLARPKNHYRTGKNAGQLKANFAATSPTKTPDADNLAKLIMDALTKVVWGDDKQITRLEVEKLWADERPETTVEIEAIGGA